MINLFCLIIRTCTFFLENINQKHKNMKLSIETEINESLSFVDVKIF